MNKNMAKTSEFWGCWHFPLGSKSDVPEDIQPSVDLPEDEGDMKNASNPSGNDNEDTNKPRWMGAPWKLGKITRLSHVDSLFYLPFHHFLSTSDQQAFLSSRKEPLDVRGQAFFEVNCEMVNSLIQKTRTETAIIKLKT